MGKRNRNRQRRKGERKLPQRSQRAFLLSRMGEARALIEIQTNADPS